jgi:hypothetical protein
MCPNAADFIILLYIDLMPDSFTCQAESLCLNGLMG